MEIKDNGSDGYQPKENIIEFTLVAIGISAIFSLCLCFICGLIACRVSRKLKEVKCPMCRLWINGKDWRNPDTHRKFCARRNEHFIKNLPEPFDIRCPTCLAYMKLMPKNFGPTFNCDDRDCPIRGTEILNNGHNRICCFVCDYDLCDSCVHRRLFVLAKCQAANSANSGLVPDNPDGNTCSLQLDIYQPAPMQGNMSVPPGPGHYPDNSIPGLSSSLNVCPVVPTVSRYIPSGSGGQGFQQIHSSPAGVPNMLPVPKYLPSGYVNSGYTNSEPPSYREDEESSNSNETCILSSLRGLEAVNAPYLLSTYV